MSSTSKRKIKMYSFCPFKITKIEYLGNIKRNINCPSPRSGHRIVVAHGNVYSFGGYNPITVDNEVEHILFKELWAYNCASHTWNLLETSGNAPDELASHCATYVKNHLLIFGGTAYPFGSRSSNDVHICNLKTLQWSKLKTSGDPPPKQYGQAMCLHENKIYVVGGTTGYAYSNEVHCLSLDSCEWKQLSDGPDVTFRHRTYEPESRYRHEIAITDNKIFVFGGGTANGSFSLNEVPVFNLESEKWEKFSTKGDIVAPRRCHSLVHVEDNVYIMGGMNAEESYNEIYKFNLKTLTWCLFLSMPFPLYFHAACISDSSQLFVFGGVDGSSNQRTNDMLTMWLKIPSLADMSWQAVLHYIPKLARMEKQKLFKMGIPIRYLNEIEFVSSSNKRVASTSTDYTEALNEGWEIL